MGNMPCIRRKIEMTNAKKSISEAFRGVAEEALENAYRWQEVPSTAIAYLEMALAAHQEAEGSLLQGMTVYRWTSVGEPIIFLRHLYSGGMDDADISGPEHGEWAYSSPIDAPVLSAISFIRGVMFAERNGRNPEDKMFAKKVDGQWTAFNASDSEGIARAPKGARKEVIQAFIDGCTAKAPEVDADAMKKDPLIRDILAPAA